MDIDSANTKAFNPTTTGGGVNVTRTGICEYGELTGENSQSKLCDFCWFCFANILGRIFFSYRPGMPARHENMNFSNFRLPPLYDTFLENLD